MLTLIIEVEDDDVVEIFRMFVQRPRKGFVLEQSGLKQPVGES